MERNRVSAVSLQMDEVDVWVSRGLVDMKHIVVKSIGRHRDVDFEETSTVRSSGEVRGIDSPLELDLSCVHEP
jgi:hypothetical protein